MKVLVTGVLGVVGSKLEEILISKGHTVFGIDLMHTSRRYGHGLGKVKDDNYFRCDIAEYRQIEDVISYVKPDYVFNCAAEFGRWNGEHFYEKVWKSNAIGVKNILKLQEKYRFKLIHCSSSEVYGDYDSIMYEDVLKKIPIEQMNDYAMSKRVNEMQIKNSNEMYGTESVIVRIFNTYGPGEWYHPFRSVNCIFTYKLLNGMPITVYRGHTRTSTYVYDCARSISNIIDNFKTNEIYNIASRDHHTIEEMTETILKYTNADRSLVCYEDKHEILTTKDKFVDPVKAEKDLNHKNTFDLDTGIKMTVDWMKDYYKFK